jgi:osmotically-inducible protein OsmY
MCAGFLAACSTSAKTPDVTKTIRQDLTNGGLKEVSVTQDRDKGVVTLAGHVATDAEKRQAEQIAKGDASDQIVANEIVVTPPGAESDAKTVSSAFDDGIQNDLKAELLRRHANEGVNYTVKAGVVTLTGKVDSTTTKRTAADVASKVPHVTQVIDELTVKPPKTA